MLFPSLRRAAYQARLVSCVNSLSQLGKGMLVYVEDYKENYPRRMININPGNQPQLVKFGPVDDRPLYTPYVDINMALVCPLSPLDSGISMVGPFADLAEEIWSSYELWCGSNFSIGDDSSGMLRVGRRPIWEGRTYDILAADLERVWEGARGFYWINDSHPDEARILEWLALNFNQGTAVGTYVVSNWMGGWGDGSGSAWGNPANIRRGLVDRNFLHDDGSVSTILGIELKIDPRLNRVPSYSHSSVYPVHNYLPALQ